MINYPNKKNTKTVVTERSKVAEKRFDLARLGMSFEEQITRANEYYLASGTAVVYKKPTPVQVVKVDYPRQSSVRITEAYFKTPSTTDFNGVADGVYLDFEAKETKYKTRFPLANVREHQIKHIFAVAKQGGFSFLLVKFVPLDEIYLLTADTLAIFWQEYEKGARASIKHSEFVSSGVLVPTNTYPSADYLKVVKELLKQKV